MTNEASLRSLRFEIPLPNWLKGHIGTRYISWIIKCFSVLLLALILITTLIGSNKPIYNFSPTFIWIIWWVGLGFVSAVLGMGTLLILTFIDTLGMRLGGVTGDIILEISMRTHFGDFARGIVDTSHIVYYLSMIAVFLFLAVRSVETRRWR